MPILRYDAALRVLVAAKGHPYVRDALMAPFDAFEGVAATLVEQPVASLLMRPDFLEAFDALVLYDMPGLDFTAPGGVRAVAPDEPLKAGLRAVLDAGKGVVALHHAIAGWPAWSEYGDLLGGRFLYTPQTVRGKALLDSGYRHDVTHRIDVVAPDHPVMKDVPSSFELTDECYLFEVFEADVTPLLRSRARFTKDEFYSAAHAVAGRMYTNDGWDHPEGSNLVGWVKRARRAPLVYLQFGDGPATFADPVMRRLLENAVRWVASPEARAWAAGEGVDTGAGAAPAAGGR
ncbi:MAG: ThuA domain-containing protein [Alphaproteobacteria bacterium]|nr:ThuA domain-containing protein [Alphaproteobacteria bacterium]